MGNMNYTEQWLWRYSHAFSPSTHHCRQETLDLKC